MKVVFVAEPGSKIVARRGGVMVVTRDGRRVPVGPDVDQVVVACSRVSVSAKAVRLLARMGVDLVVLDADGYPAARLYPPYINKTVATRVAQYARALSSFGLSVARELVCCKIHNQAQVLKYLAKSLREPWLRDLGYEVDGVAAELSQEPASSLTRDKIMSYESRAARKYWQALASVLPSDLEFEGRDPEAPDPFNAALNYGYGILYNVCEKALVLAGLDPYLGVLHALRSGKPSLTLDFVEMFRPVAVDKPLVVAARRVELKTVAGRLDYESRKRVAEAVLSNLNARYRCSKRPRSLPLGEQVKREAWDLASSLREGREYLGFRVYL